MNPLLKPYAVAAHILADGTLTTIDMLTSQTARDLYKSLWILAQVTFWLSALAMLYTLQAGRRFRAYYRAEGAATGRDILTYPDRCLKPSTALAIAADSSDAQLITGSDRNLTVNSDRNLTAQAIPTDAQLILNSDRHSTAKLRALASFYDLPWRNARGPGKHLLNQQIKQALNAYPNVYQALSSQ